MKKITLFLAIAMLLGCFAGCGGNTETPEVSTDPPPPALTGTVTIEGEATADQPITAKATLNETDAVVTYEWRVDGVVLDGFTGESCQVPATAGGKKLSVAVKCADEAYCGSVESEEVTVKANEATKMTLAGLYNDMKILGRTPVEGTGISTCWPGTGFSINVKSDGGTFKLGVNVGTNSSTLPYYCVEVDGVQVDRPMMIGTMEYTLDLSAGEHTVTVYRDSANSPQIPCKLEYIDFAGEVLAKPENKALYIEVVGDSISCGLGSLGTYTPGVDWVNEEHSVSNSFGWYVAQDFGADVSVVAKGGIGAVKAANDKNMPQIYPYVNGYVAQEPYDFARKPDLVIVALSANDGSYTEQEFGAGMKLVYQQIMEGYGSDVKILWVGKNEKFCEVAKSVAAELGVTHYAMTYNYGVSGSGPSIAAAAHPSKDEHRTYADAITKFIKDNSLLG